MKKIFILTLLCAAVIATSCSKSSDDDSDEVVATGISINQQSLSIGMEQTVTLEATVTPEDADDRMVTWSSSDPTVATVSEEGEVRGIKAGTANITATSNSGGYTAICIVTVSNEKYVAVTSVSIDKGTLTLSVGKKEILTATILPENATTQNVTWTSQDNTIATVSTTGEVTAVAVGTTMIKVVTLDGEYADVCEVEVQAEAKVGFANESNPEIDGSSWEKAYEIANLKQLILLSTRIKTDNAKPRLWATKYYKLTADINVNSGGITEWTPIDEFSGHFDGGGHVIEGRLIAGKNLKDCFGLFGYVSGGEIRNLHFNGSINISAITVTDMRIGAIAGQCTGTTTVTNCTNTASISGNGDIGGIIGYVSGTAKIIACQNSGSMTSNTKNVGGIAAMAPAGTLIVGCINKGTTMTMANNTGNLFAGGIVGCGAPIACWSTATSIIGQADRIGAITGWLTFNETDFVPSNCHWNPINGVKGIGQGSGEKNYSSFISDTPTVHMASDMNKVWQAILPTTAYGFNEHGEIVKM